MKKIIIALIMLFLIVPAFAEEKPVWVEAVGEAYLSEVDTEKEVMERARKDAQNRAVEQARGAFINAHTLVSNAQLAEDLVYAAVRGKTVKVEIIEEGWDKSDRKLYRARLKALVEPVYPESGAGLSVKLSLSKSDLKEGEEVKLFYQSSADCFVYIFSVAADGSVTLLFPNSAMPDSGIQAGKSYTFPPDDRIKLQAQLLPGAIKAEERIKIIATRKKEDIVPLGFKEGFFKVYDARSTGMISDLTKRLNQLEPAEWTQAQTAYRLSR